MVQCTADHHLRVRTPQDSNRLEMTGALASVNNSGPDSTGVDKFTVKVDGVAESIVYTRTYDGGDLSDCILVDNTGGAVPKIVTLVAHNGDALTPHQASGHILVEDVTDVMA